MNRSNEDRLLDFENNPARFIDHTNLRTSARQSDIDQLCDEAIRFKFKSVCVNPCWVEHCKERLKSSDVELCTVIGFPLGANTPQVKSYEIRKAIEDGATEIDLVMNVGLFLSTQTHPPGSQPTKTMSDFKHDFFTSIEHITSFINLKVIIETSVLESDQISEISHILSEIPQVKFVKTSTGFNGSGATVENVTLIRKAVGEKCDVKASGGVKTLEECLKFIEVGAGRIGTSSGVKIIEVWQRVHSNQTS